MAEPETTASPEHEIQPAPDPTFDKEAALAEHNRALKWKLREAVAVANGCHRAIAQTHGSIFSNFSDLCEAARRSW